MQEDMGIETETGSRAGTENPSEEIQEARAQEEKPVEAATALCDALCAGPLPDLRARAA